MGPDFRKSAYSRRSSRRTYALGLFVVLLFLYLVQDWDPPAASPLGPHRTPDTTDIFREFVGRDTCAFGALDLHRPFEPLCENTRDLLKAMTDGEREGFDAPYMPRGCDLRFYTGLEMCSILSRFESIVIYGDSLMRHVTAAFAMLLRENVEYGGQQQWMNKNFRTKDDSCLCDGQTQLWFCHQTDVSDLDQIYADDPTSIVCPQNARPRIRFQTVTHWPMDETALSASINATLAEKRPAKPYAFIFGHGLWNEMRQFESIAWIDQVQAAIAEQRAYYRPDNVFFPRVFITPSAAGKDKAKEYLETQGNPSIISFEQFMRKSVPDRDIDFLGTYNMSILGTIPDGTHSGIRINILKVMTVMNWLDMLDISQWDNPGPPKPHRPKWATKPNLPRLSPAAPGSDPQNEPAAAVAPSSTSLSKVSRVDVDEAEEEGDEGADTTRNTDNSDVQGVADGTNVIYDGDTVIIEEIFVEEVPPE